MSSYQRPSGPPSGVCAKCGVWHERVELDHIKALCLGGAHDVTNLQWLCGPCHRAKTTKDIRSRNKGKANHRRATLKRLAKIREIQKNSI